MYNKIYDCIIIGAGSTGLYCAKKLASYSFDVLVIEAKKEIGKDIICAGIISKKAFDEYDLNRNSIIGEIKDIKIISPSGNYIIYEHPEILSYVVDRELFNKNLSDQAILAGANIILDTYIYDIEKEDDCIIILGKNTSKEKKKFYARSVIIATGINYNLNKKLKLGYPSNFLKGWQSEVICKDVQTTTIILNNNLALGGFIWAVPINNNIIRLGLMAEKAAKQDVDLIMKSIGIKEYSFNKDNRIMRKPIAQGLISRTFTDRVLIVGEAAAQVKTTTGGGVYFGLFCGDIACEVLSKALKDFNLSASYLSKYEKLWKKAIKKEIIVGYYLRKIFSKLNERTIERVFKAIQSDGIIQEIKSKIDFDWHIETTLSTLRKISFHKYIL